MVGRLDAHAFHDVGGGARFAALSMKKRSERILAEVVDRDVLLDREVGDQPFGLAALGQNADARAQRIGGIGRASPARR